MTAATQATQPSPLATAGAFQALKTSPRLFAAVVDNVELGPRACQHFEAAR